DGGREDAVHTRMDHRFPEAQAYRMSPRRPAGLGDAAFDVPPGIPAVGQEVAGKYKIERVLGVGGMGVVLAAKHLRLEEPVAIKILLPELARRQEIVTRFMREARAAARIKS